MSGIQMALMQGAQTALGVGASDVSGFEFGSSSSGSVTSIGTPGTSVAYGTGPYTYSWTLESSISGAVPTISPSSSNPNPDWTATVVDGTDSVSIWRITVTDSLSATASTTIKVTLTWVQV